MNGLVRTKRLTTSEAVYAGLLAGVLAATAMALVSMGMVGTMIHVATAVAFGISFVILVGRRSYGPAVMAGIVYGLGIWVIMHFAVLPVLNPVMAAMPPFRLAVLHIILALRWEAIRLLCDHR